MSIVGITGLIGSGKTTVGQILRSMGYVVYNMDVWCRQLYNDPVFIDKIYHHFDFCFENGVFNKKILRKTVFENQTELKKLENLTHPQLIDQFKYTVHYYRFEPYPVFIESALLKQMGLDKYCSDVIETTAPVDVMQDRVMKRDHITKEDYLNIYHQQNQKENKKYQKNHFMIDTNQNTRIIKADLIKLLQRIEQC